MPKPKPKPKPNKLTLDDVNLLEQWWVEKSRVNFFAFRQYMRYGNFKYNWFNIDLSRQLQQFYVDLINKKRPILVISTPPQHGKSWAVGDAISWMIGKIPEARVIYSSFSDRLSSRCNKHIQRFMDHSKYRAIFPEVSLSDKKDGKLNRNNTHLEFMGSDGQPTGGEFRNTTVGGPVTGETLDIGIIDDPFKGREQANSQIYRDKIWDWYTDDFGTRFDEYAGTLIIKTRWHIDGLVGRLQEKDSNVKVVNYPAIADTDEEHRKRGEALFPEHKSLEFLHGKKKLMFPAYFESLYQGNPTIKGGEIFKDSYWKWWDVLPPLQYKFITADTAQKTKTQNDYTCFQCWGYGINDCIYLIDMFYDKLEAPELRREAAAFYHKHDTRRTDLNEPVLRGFYIEDKSSGTGLIQELKRKKLKVFEVPRSVDKVERFKDASPYVESGRVYLNENVPYVSVITDEGRLAPNGVHDDAIDTTTSAIETAFIDDQPDNMEIGSIGTTATSIQGDW